jgi:hypothetical protein
VRGKSVVGDSNKEKGVNRRYGFVVVVAGALALGACGGGGGGGGGGTGDGSMAWGNVRAMAKGADPAAAPTPDGGFVAAWAEPDPATSLYAIKVAVQDAAGKWSSAETISGSGNNLGSRVVFDGDGTLEVVWKNAAGIWINKRPAGGSWGAPFQIVATTNAVTNLSLALDAAGDGVLVWEEQVSPAAHLVKVRQRTGKSGAWLPVTLSSGSTESRAPAVRMNSAGKFALGWDVNDGANIDVYVSTYDPSSGWANYSEQNVFAAGTYSSSVQVAIDESGDAAWVWTRDAGGVPTVVARRVVGGVTQPAEVIETAPDAGAIGPRLAVNGAGGVVAVWGRADSVHAGTYGVRSAALSDGAWSAPITIKAQQDVYAMPMELAIDGSGTALATLFVTTPGACHLSAARRNTGGAWQVTDRIDAGKDVVYAAATAVAQDGRALAFWSTYGYGYLRSRLFE